MNKNRANGATESILPMGGTAEKKAGKIGTIDSTSYETALLPNGVRAAVAEMPYMESVSIGIWSGVGSRHESDELSGIAHFAEHMVFKGTQRWSSRELTAEVEAVGGDIDAYTMADQTCYYIKGPAESLPKFLDVLADLYLRPLFPAEEVNREREVIREEIVSYREQPNQHVEGLLGFAAWPNSPVGRLVTGTSESIANITRESLLEFTSEHYRGSKTVAAVAGRIDSAETLERLGKVLGKVPSGASASGSPGSPGGPDSDLHAASGLRLLFDKRDTDQVQIGIGFLCSGRHDEQQEALRALNVLLGGSMSSRLWQTLREDRGLCYEVQTELQTLDDGGLFQLYAGVDADNVHETLKVALAEIRDLAENGPTEEELRGAIDYANGTQRVALEDTASQMLWAGESLLHFQRVIEPRTARESLETVTADDVRRVAAKIFAPANLAGAFVGPQEETAELRTILESW
jgi:predicted Zn-dependent peptidase